MASSNSVNILEVCQVAPSSNSPDSAAEFSLPLTFFDLLFFKFPSIKRVFLYEFTESTPAFFNSEILPRLKQSLSLALLHFLPLAGQVTWPQSSAKPIILYTPNDTVSLTVSESNADFHQVSSNEVREAIELDPYAPDLSVSDNSVSVIAFQVTLFPNQGFSIGYTINHVVLDGRSVTMFFKSWAYICKTLEREEQPQILPELVPVFDRTLVKDPSDLGTLFLSQWQALTESHSTINPRSLKPLTQVKDPTNIVRSTFELTYEDISKLKEKVLSELNSTQQYLSSFVVTCAYVLVCMVKSQEEGDDNRNIRFSFPVDCRRRLDPPLPSNYFGNCLSGHGLIGAATDFRKERGISIAAEKIGNSIKGLEDCVLDGLEDIIPKFRELQQGVRNITVAGSTRFDVYKNDFGWGKPKKVEIPSIARSRYGAISLMESRNGNGGVEIGVALPKGEMEVFASLFVNGLKGL